MNLPILALATASVTVASLEARWQPFASTPAMSVEDAVRALGEPDERSTKVRHGKTFTSELIYRRFSEFPGGVIVDCLPDGTVTKANFYLVAKQDPWNRREADALGRMTSPLDLDAFLQAYGTPASTGSAKYDKRIARYVPYPAAEATLSVVAVPGHDAVHRLTVTLAKPKKGPSPSPGPR